MPLLVLIYIPNRVPHFLVFPFPDLQFRCGIFQSWIFSRSHQTLCSGR